FVLPFSSSIEFGDNNALLLEYAHVLNNNTENGLNPMSVGIQFGTAGHTFQVFVNSNNSILEQQLYTSENHDYKSGDFSLGFNIKRIWWF
ncbi:MAG: DUF5777 family beta-barrel protein, partial [Flavobacteriales bacterium]